MADFWVGYAMASLVYIHIASCFLPVPNYLQRNIQPQRGPVCFDCAVMDHPNSCTHLTICNIGQVCMLREIRDFSTGSLKYHTSCESPLVCAGYGVARDLIGRRQTHGCLSCCYIDYCNDQCDNHGVSQLPTTLSTLPANNGIGVYCYNCPNMDVPNACLTFTLCSEDQVCMIRDLYVTSSNKIEYAASCESKQVCHALSSIAPSNRCHECCTTDFCNDKCNTMTPHVTSTQALSTTKQPTMRPTPAPTPQVKTTFPAPTTHSNDRWRVCYSCNSVDDISHCLNIAQCLSGQICMLSEQAPDQTGKITYTASCENKQVCDALSKLHESTSHRVCHVCCDDDLCNRDCGDALTPPLVTKAHATIGPALTPPITNTPVTIGPVPQHTPTIAPVANTKSTQTSSILPGTTLSSVDTDPLQCYECPNMSDVDDCTNIVTCGRDKVCMIRDVPFPHSGGREFATSCESAKVCEVLNTLPGKRAALCHRCCNTTLCNNVCD